MSRQAKDDFLRHYTVSDPRTHPKGYTEYKVTAQFISKKDPEDVKEVRLPEEEGLFCEPHTPWGQSGGTATSASCMETWPTPTATSSAASRSSPLSPGRRCLAGSKPQ
uniref:Sorting nexin 15 n=1 Tax=Prolemur simus TaxID=1328070 RepID=A0A8C8YL94_PROSS